MSRHKDIAKALLREAEADLNSARLLLVGGVSALEKEGTRTEYPLFGRPDLPIWIPSEHYGREDATKALAKAEYVFQAISDLLSQRYQIQ